MNRHLLLASATLFSLAVAAPALADDLNPQPLPPGVHSKTSQHMIGSATSGAGSGKAQMRKAGGTQMNGATQAGGGGGPGKVGLHDSVGTQTNTITNAGVTHGFNPQPDPPGDTPTQTQAQH